MAKVKTTLIKSKYTLLKVKNKRLFTFQAGQGLKGEV